ncbi:MAG TPA: hypothetical protein VEK37_15210 [Gemmatimonadaceae bacterium]|nr:hypothetical protein [Gemmatimonadaceae bacterium]
MNLGAQTAQLGRRRVDENNSSVLVLGHETHVSPFVGKALGGQIVSSLGSQRDEFASRLRVSRGLLVSVLGLLDYCVKLSEQCLGVLRGIALGDWWALAAATW